MPYSRSVGKASRIDITAAITPPPSTASHGGSGVCSIKMPAP